MSDVPDKIMKAAMEAYESLSVACISSRPIDFRAEDIVIVARALVAADEAATKRERARIASQFTAEATAIEVDEHEKAQWGGPDPRGSRVRHLRLGHARELRNVASAILKGDA